jgi:hypothetical protein
MILTKSAVITYAKRIRAMAADTWIVSLVNPSKSLNGKNGRIIVIKSAITPVVISQLAGLLFTKDFRVLIMYRISISVIVDSMNHPVWKSDSGSLYIKYKR